MRKLAAAFVAIVMVLFGIVLVVNNAGEVNSPSEEGIMKPQQTVAAIQNVKEFSVTGKNFQFSLNSITVKQGDRVKINFTSDGGMHDFRLDEFGAATKVLQNDQTDTVEFSATDKGEFEYYCSVGNHRQQGMVGKLIVE